MCKCEGCRRKRPDSESKVLRTIRTLDYGLVVTFIVLGLTVGMVSYAGYLEVASQSLWHKDGVFKNVTALPEESPKNLHPLSMAVGFFGLQSLGILLYRVCCCYCRQVVTILHTILTVSGLILGCAGLTYNHPFLLAQSHFKSFHSRLGIVTIVVATLQAIVGAILYVAMKMMNPVTSALRRTLYTPYHNIAGVSIFLCSALCCVSGMEISTHFSYPLESTLYYLTLSPRAKTLFHSHMIYLNYVRLLFILLSLLIFYSLLKEDFRSRGRILMARDEEYR